MSAGRICSRIVATAAPDEMVRAAAKRMAEHDVGTLVVVEPNDLHKPIGILTDRDIAVRCVAKGLDPDKTAVSDVTSKPVQSVDESTPIEETVAKMAKTATRRLVVTGTENRLVGIVTLDDVMGLLTEEAAAISQLLGKQEPHIPA